MREIKFRAWDEVKKVMLNSNTYGMALHFDGKLNTLNLGIVAGTANTRQLELMQFTGLRDSKRTEEYPEGQEIYEGDIVKGLSADKQTISNGVITFMGCDYIVKFSEGSARGFYYLHHMLCNAIEVIGNKFQNPELL